MYYLRHIWALKRETMFPTGSAFHKLLCSFAWQGISSVSPNKIMQEIGPVQSVRSWVSALEIPPTSGSSDTCQCSPKNDLTPVASMSTQHNERPGVRLPGRQTGKGGELPRRRVFLAFPTQDKKLAQQVQSQNRTCCAIVLGPLSSLATWSTAHLSNWSTIN